MSLLGAIASLAGLWFYIRLIQDLPPIDFLPSLLEPPHGAMLQPTRLYDRSSQHVILSLENPAAAGKQYLRVSRTAKSGVGLLPQYLVNATVAELDPDFWRHHGYTLAGIVLGTHPTIAQRLVSDLLLDNESPSLSRNIRERLLAAQVTSRYGQEKILEWYLNSTQYGELLYGADAAARAYFGKSADSLSLAESAMLTIIAESQSFDPYTRVHALKKQQEELIQRMLNLGLVNPDEAQHALTEEMSLQVNPVPHSDTSVFTDLVLRQLSSVLSLDRLRRGGYEIVTSLDYDLQAQVTCTIQLYIARLQGIPEKRDVAGDDQCEAARLLPGIELNQVNQSQEIGAELVILDPDSGQILSLVGDDNSGMEPADPPRHPAGTILSPFLYLTAFTQGMSPASILWDVPPAEAGFGGPGSDLDATTLNESDSYHGPVRLRVAMMNDYTASSIDVFKRAGADHVRQTIQSFGVPVPETKLPGSYTLEGIYSQPVSLLELVQAYAVFAHQGTMAGQSGLVAQTDPDPNRLNPISVLKVSTLDGRDSLDWTTAQSRSIITPQLAYLVTHVLSDDSIRQPGSVSPEMLKIDQPAAVKLGVTSDGTNGWAIGYIPQLAVGVWFGHPQADMSPITQEIPAGLWHALMEYASRRARDQEFAMPEGISTVQVCDPSGMLVSDICPSVVDEIFLSGNEPTLVDDLYQKYYLDRQTGLLATVFTPPDQVEGKVFLAIPPQAMSWAKQSGLAMPPDQYDAFTSTQPGSSDVHFTSPQMSAYVRGQVILSGSAAGNDFAYYRLQVGQGMYPQKWMQVGMDVTTQVQESTLGTWDTTGLDGTYIMQLLVVRQYQRIEQAYLQLTVDNFAPQVSLISPVNSEKLVYQDGGSVLLQASSSDNQSVERVEFYVDETLISTLWKPPFVSLWPMQVGEHRLLTKVYDQAGNISQAVITFSVDK